MPRIVAVEFRRTHAALWWLGLFALVLGLAGTIAATVVWLKKS